jgi:hypothetical protein
MRWQRLPHIAVKIGAFASHDPAAAKNGVTQGLMASVTHLFDAVDLLLDGAAAVTTTTNIGFRIGF